MLCLHVGRRHTAVFFEYAARRLSSSAPSAWRAPQQTMTSGQTSCQRPWRWCAPCTQSCCPSWKGVRRQAAGVAAWQASCAAVHHMPEHSKDQQRRQVMQHPPLSAHAHSQALPSQHHVDIHQHVCPAMRHAIHVQTLGGLGCTFPLRTGVWAGTHTHTHQHAPLPNPPPPLTPPPHTHTPPHLPRQPGGVPPPRRLCGAAG
jgi:hypothetical protein